MRREKQTVVRSIRSPVPVACYAILISKYTSKSSLLETVSNPQALSMLGPVLISIAKSLSSRPKS